MKVEFSRIFFVFFLCFFSHLAYPQELVQTMGTSQLELPRDKSRTEVESKLHELAVIDAMERAFGRVIIQGNSTYLSNIQTGEKVETISGFSSVANTFVKGELVEVLDEKFFEINGFTVIEGKKKPVTEIKCEIVIKAREITAPPVTFTAFPLNCLDEKCKTTSFRYKDPLYLFFISPIDGYLMVYLDNNSSSQCLYPHYLMSSGFEGGVPVEADKKYFLFSNKPEYEYFPKMNITPVTYELISNSNHEMNRLFIIFSKNPLNKPPLNDMSEKLLDKGDYAQGYRMPRSLPSEDFQRWLNNYRSMDRTNAQVAIVNITISK
jgi:hypothetical protein